MHRSLPTAPPRRGLFVAPDPAAALLLAAHNRLRAVPLVLDASLTASAAGWARVMAASRWMRHGDFAGRIRAAGFRGGSVGENIAYGYPSVSAVMAGWAGDAPHLANIRNPLFTRVGFGYYPDARGVWYWAADFGG